MGRTESAAEGQSKSGSIADHLSGLVLLPQTEGAWGGSLPGQPHPARFRCSGAPLQESPPDGAHVPDPHRHTRSHVHKHQSHTRHTQRCRALRPPQLTDLALQMSGSLSGSPGSARGLGLSVLALGGLSASPPLELPVQWDPGGLVPPCGEMPHLWAPTQPSPPSLSQSTCPMRVPHHPMSQERHAGVRMFFGGDDRPPSLQSHPFCAWVTLLPNTGPARSPSYAGPQVASHGP